MKSIDYIVVAILVVALALLGFKLFNRASGKDKLVFNVDSTTTNKLLYEIRDSIGVVKGYIDKRIGENELKRSDEYENLRSNLKHLGIRMKDFESQTNLMIISSDSINARLVALANKKPPIGGRDTTYIQALGNTRYAMEYRNRNLELDGIFDTEKKEFKGDYSYNANISLTKSWKRRFLRDDLLILNVQSDDPNLLIDVKSLNKQPKKTLFDISLQGGYGFGYVNGKINRFPYLGIGASKKLISIKKKN